MISHVLGKGQGYPVGYKMPGAFKTVEDMLRAFVRDYKPRSSKPEQGKAQEQDLMLITFTDEEIDCIKEQTMWEAGFSAIADMAIILNEGLGLEKGFEAVSFDTVPESMKLNLGLFFCPDSIDPFVAQPRNEDPLSTGPTQDENLDPVSYIIFEFFRRNEADP